MSLKVLVTAVTAEVTSLSLVVPAILSKRVVLISLKTNEGATGHVSAPLLHPFSSIKARFTVPAVPLTRVSARAAEFVSEDSTRARTAG